MLCHTHGTQIERREFVSPHSCSQSTVLLLSVHVHVAPYTRQQCRYPQQITIQCVLHATMSGPDIISRTNGHYTSCVGFTDSALYIVTSLLLQEVKFLSLTSRCSGRVTMLQWRCPSCFRFHLLLHQEALTTTLLSPMAFVKKRWTSVVFAKLVSFHAAFCYNQH
jgi:hypothetical protein